MLNIHKVNKRRAWNMNGSTANQMLLEILQIASFQWKQIEATVGEMKCVGHVITKITHSYTAETH